MPKKVLVGFASLSDENDHKAEAIHTSLNPKIKELAEKGFKEITIVSDSPTSQYRNGKNAYLTKQWAEHYKIRICWIFTEAGHGKSAADGIGGNIKNLAQDKQNMDTDCVIQNVEDVKNKIETKMDLIVHTKQHIDEVRDLMPNKIGVLKGATLIHELLFEPNGQIKMNKMPNEALYKPVTVKVGNLINRRRRVHLNQAFIVNETIDELELEGEEATVTVEEETEAEEIRSRLRLRRRLVKDIQDEIDQEDYSDEYYDSEDDC